jgi:hypothetical protein
MATVQIISHEYKPAYKLTIVNQRPAVECGIVNLYFDTWDEFNTTLDSLREQANQLRNKEQ